LNSLEYAHDVAYEIYGLRFWEVALSVAGIGHNSGYIDLSKESEIEKVVRVVKAEYNSAAAQKRDANGVMRDEKRAFQAENASVYEEINAIMESARDRMKTKLRNREAYQKAEDEKRDASIRMKAALKKLKAAGLDAAAFKQMLRMAEMDEEERKDYFDSIDLYCKVARLW
jgi:uncharacterized protein (UPF0335 family)